MTLHLHVFVRDSINKTPPGPPRLDYPGVSSIQTKSPNLRNTLFKLWAESASSMHFEFIPILADFEVKFENLKHFYG